MRMTSVTAPDLFESSACLKLGVLDVFILVLPSGNNYFKYTLYFGCGGSPPAVIVGGQGLG